MDVSLAREIIVDPQMSDWCQFETGLPVEPSRKSHDLFSESLVQLKDCLDPIGGQVHFQSVENGWMCDALTVFFPSEGKADERYSRDLPGLHLLMRNGKPKAFTVQPGESTELKLACNKPVDSLNTQEVWQRMHHTYDAWMLAESWRFNSITDAMIDARRAG